MASVDLGSVHGKLILDTSGWTSGVDIAKQKLAGLGQVSGEQSSKVISSWEAVGKKMKAIGAQMSLAITTPLVLMGKKAINTAAEFDSTMRTIAAVGGLGEERLKELEKVAIEFGRRGVFSAQEVAQAMTDMVRDGLDPATEGFERQIEAAHNLAAASGVGLYAAQIALSNSMFNFGMGAEDAGKASDVLANVLNKTQLEMEDIADSMSYVGPIASQAGLSFEQTAAAIGIMGQAGIKGSMAGTTLRRALINLQAPTTAQREALDSLGISVFDSEGKMKDFGVILGDFEKSLSGLTEEQKIQATEAIFGAQAVSGMLAVVSSGADTFNEMTDSMSEQGTAARIAKERQQGLSNSATRLKSATFELSKSFGDALAPAVDSTATMMEGLAKWFGDLDPKWQTAITGLLGFAAAIGPLLVLASMFAPGGILAIGFGVIMTAIGGLASFIGLTVVPALAGFVAAFGPILLVAGLIAAAAYLIWKNWDVIVEFFTVTLPTKLNEAWTGILAYFQTLPEKMLQFGIDIITGLWTGIENTLGLLITGIAYIVGLFIYGLPAIWNWLKTNVPVWWNTFIQWMTNLIPRIKEKLNEWLNRIVEWGTNTWNYLSEAVPRWLTNVVTWFGELPGRTYNATVGVIAKLKEVFTKTWSTVSGELSTWPGRLKDWGENLARAFVSGFSKLGDWIKDKVKAGLNAAKALIEGHSPPKSGPFRQIDKWGESVASAWVEGFGSGFAGLEGAMNYVMPKPSYAFSTNGGGSAIGNSVTHAPQMNVHIGVYAGSEMEKREIARQLFESYADYQKGMGMLING